MAILSRNLWYQSQSIASTVHAFTCPPEVSHIGKGYLGEAILGLGKSLGPEYKLPVWEPHRVGTSEVERGKILQTYGTRHG